MGKNWRLALAELDQFLRNKKFEGQILDYSANIAIVEFSSLHKEKYYVDKLEEMQYFLGGTQKIAKIYDFIDRKTLKDAFPLHMEKFRLVENSRKRIKKTLNSIISEIFPKIQKKEIFFANSIYPIFFDQEYYKKVLVQHFLPFLNKKVSKICKKKGAKKAIYFKYPIKNIKSGNLNPIFPHHVINYELLKENRAEIIYGMTEEGIYIARTYTVDDPNFKQKIDEERPRTEFKSSISPKLATIMLNFLNLFENRPNKKILDPFIGNGTIAMFGIIENFQIFGSDKDKQKVEASKMNIKWLLKELGSETVPYLDDKIKVAKISELSKLFKENSFDGIATEPDLGEFYTSKPYYTEAISEMKDKLEPLYQELFREAYKILKPNARLCLMAPSISVLDDQKDIRLNIVNMANNFKFEMIPLISSNRIVNKSNIRLQFRKDEIYSILDAKDRQVVKRKLYVFEKQE